MVCSYWLFYTSSVHNASIDILYGQLLVWWRQVYDLTGKREFRFVDYTSWFFSYRWFRLSKRNWKSSMYLILICINYKGIHYEDNGKYVYVQVHNTRVLGISYQLSLCYMWKQLKLKQKIRFFFNSVVVFDEKNHIV